MRDTRIGKANAAFSQLWGFLHTRAFTHIGGRRQRAVMCFRQFKNLFWRDITSDDQNGIVGRIEPLIESRRVFARQVFHLVAPTDDRDPIRVIQKCGCVDLLAE